VPQFEIFPQKHKATKKNNAKAIFAFLVSRYLSGWEIAIAWCSTSDDAGISDLIFTYFAAG